MRIITGLSLALSVLSSVSAATTYGLTLRGSKSRFVIFNEATIAENVVQSDEGSISWVSTAAEGSAGGVAFYAKSNGQEINLANYESMDIELDYSVVANKWNDAAKKPGFCIRALPWDTANINNGYEDIECIDTEETSGTLVRNIKITSDLINRILASADFDSILGFAIKFNDLQRGNNFGDQIQIELKNVTLNPKKKAPKDKPFNDGLKKSQHGTVEEIWYPTRDYTVAEENLTESDRYDKHAWVYLPAGYNAKDTKTKYPVYILLHGFMQNENSWGLTNQGRGGRIKGYMDRGMASGIVEKFILVVVNDMASKNWGPNGDGMDIPGSDAFGGELRNDLLPYLRANYNIKSGRDNVAMAGLSMGAALTYRIGIRESLDLISNFGVFAGALSSEPEADDAIYNFLDEIDANPAYEGLKIHNFYMNCGDNDMYMWEKYKRYVGIMKSWDRIENIRDYTYPGGTHDFPVFHQGFKEFLPMVFKEAQPGKNILEIIEGWIQALIDFIKSLFH